MKDIFGVFAVMIAVFTLINFIKRKYEQWSINRIIRKKLGPKKEFPPYVMETVEEQEARHKRAYEEYYGKVYGSENYVNRETKALKFFIINNNIGPLDIHKLGQLNGYKIFGLDGWLPLMVDMIKELDQVGWNREVPTIKEKFGELRFHALDPKWKSNRAMEKKAWDILDKYLELSKVTCQICGNPGVWETINGWDQTRCAEHRNTHP